MIIVHNQLIRFPDIAFFTSPIPLHIAAMVILYGHMSKCDTLPQKLAVQDLWLALDMLPRFRWRWERRDFGGGHPLIAKLAERVMEADLKQVGPVAHPALLCEPPWDDETFSPGGTSSQSTPTIASASYATGSGSAAASGGVVYGPQQQQRPVLGKGKATSSPPGSQLADVPTQLFYPFYPEYSLPSNAAGGAANGAAGSQQRDCAQLLEVAAAAQDGTYGCQPSHDSFISEERDPHRGFQQGMQTPAWMSSVSASVFLRFLSLMKRASCREERTPLHILVVNQCVNDPRFLALGPLVYGLCMDAFIASCLSSLSAEGIVLPFLLMLSDNS